MADKAAAIAALDEIKKELDRVKEALLKKGPDAESNDEAFVNVIQSVHALSVSVQKGNEDPPKGQSGFPAKRARTVEESGQTSEGGSVSDELMAVIKKAQVSLLTELPTSSAYEDTIVMKTLLYYAARFPGVLPLFGFKGAVKQVLNPTSIERSCSDDVLQAFMAALVVETASFQDCSKILHDCPGVMPFLIPCLRSKTAETKGFALRLLSWLTSEASNCKVVVESGGIEPLLELIQEKDSVGLPRAATALFFICKVVENRERAVDEGVVIAAMDNVRSGVLVYQMLEILGTLSGHEKAVVQMEENGVVECLFGILRDENVEGKDKICSKFCVSIVHKMCDGDAAKTKRLIDGVENGRDTLERVVSSGTTEAMEKASELLLKMDSADDLAT